MCHKILLQELGVWAVQSALQASSRSIVHRSTDGQLQMKHETKQIGQTASLGNKSGLGAPPQI